MRFSRALGLGKFVGFHVLQGMPRSSTVQPQQLHFITQGQEVWTRGKVNDQGQRQGLGL